MTISQEEIPETVVTELIRKSLTELCDIYKKSHPTEGGHVNL